MDGSPAGVAASVATGPSTKKYVPPHLRKEERHHAGAVAVSSAGLGSGRYPTYPSSEDVVGVSPSRGIGSASRQLEGSSRMADEESSGEGRGSRLGDSRTPPRESRASAFRDGMQGRSSAGAGRMHRQSTTGTGWDVRDGRAYRREKSADIFSADKLQSTGIKFDAYDKVPVELQGRGSAKIVAIESFQEIGCKFSPLLMSNVTRVNYNRPTPIQKNSIPTILSGRDLMACAQTGSGKTAAFLYPIIAQMLQTGPPAPVPNERHSLSSFRRAVYPVCLVLSPTRELAMQIYQEARKFQFGTGIRTVAVYGGNQVKKQLSELDMGCDICVATPGRLADVLQRGKVRLALVRYLVLDEADRMLDMGFLPQIRSIVDDFDLPPCPPPGTRAEEGPPRGRQTIMFSATFPKEIQTLAKDFMHDYIYLAVGRVGSTNEFIRQRLLYAEEDQKIKLLVNLLRESEKGLVIVFVETKKKADMIERYLINEDFPAISIHGDRTQEEREQALRYFKSGRCPFLVATDVAARGLDISNVKHVINYDLPSNIDDYVHRIGRTGRAGNLGLATSFVNEQNRPILRDLLHLLVEANQEIPGFLHPLVVSCTSSSSRMGGRGGFGRVGSSRMGGNTGSRGPAPGSSAIGGGRTTGSNDWRPVGFAASSGFAADRTGGAARDAW